MVASFVQAWTAVKDGGAGSITTGAKTTTTGNQIFVAITANTANAPTITDTSTSTWLQGQAMMTGVADATCLYYAENITGNASHTISVTVAGASSICVAAIEYSGLLSSSTIDQKHTGLDAGGSSSTLDSGSTPTTTQADEVVIGFGNLITGSDSTFTGTGGSTVRSQVGTGSVSSTVCLEDKVVSATGAQSSTCTFGVSGPWVFGAVTFKAAGGAAAPSTARQVAVLGVGSQGPFAWQWLQRVGVDAVTGTVFTSSLSGSATATGALADRTNKALAGTSTGTGALAKLDTKPLAGSSTATGALARQDQKALGGSSTSTGVVTFLRAVVRAFSGSITGTGALTKLDTKPLAGTSPATGALAKQDQKALAGSSTATGALAKLVAKAFAGTSTFSGALSFLKVLLRTYSGSLTAAGALTKQDQKALTGSSTATGTVAKQDQKALTGTSTASGALAKRANKAFAGSSTFTGVVTFLRAVVRSFSGSSTPAGALVRQPQKGLTGTSTASATLVRAVAINRTGTLTGAGTVAKLVRRAYSGILTAIGTATMHLVGAALPPDAWHRATYRFLNRKTYTTDNRATYRFRNRKTYRED